jgi:DNA-binding transcriptional regulator YiaG
MKPDAAMGKFDRLLVWKVSRLGRDMREVISTVYELADLGITVVPVKSQIGPISSTMGKLLWAIQAWYAQMENDERSQTIKAGLARAKKNGKILDRPRRVFDRFEILRLRDEQHLPWREISARLGVGLGTVHRAYTSALDAPHVPQRFWRDCTVCGWSRSICRGLVECSAIRTFSNAPECSQQLVHRDKSAERPQYCRETLPVIPTIAQLG